jgi:hypothetical protein
MSKRTRSSTLYGSRRYQEWAAQQAQPPISISPFSFAAPLASLFSSSTEPESPSKRQRTYLSLEEQLEEKQQAEQEELEAAIVQGYLQEQAEYQREQERLQKQQEDELKQQIQQRHQQYQTEFLNPVGGPPPGIPRLRPNPKGESRFEGLECQTSKQCRRSGRWLSPSGLPRGICCPANTAAAHRCRLTLADCSLVGRPDVQRRKLLVGEEGIGERATLEEIHRLATARQTEWQRALERERDITRLQSRFRPWPQPQPRPPLPTEQEQGPETIEEEEEEEEEDVDLTPVWLEEELRPLSAPVFSFSRPPLLSPL